MKMDLKEMKLFLKYYNRWLLSILSDFSSEEMPEELYEGVLDNMISDEDIKFIYKIYREIEFKKSIKKHSTIIKGITQ
ncbi:MAG: hypothetical protein QME58_13720 [Bacteroidota bacterium]|nr:hypothetical protein [Bacteroidota bacterium]